MTSLETKCVRRYFRRGCAGGRGGFARAVDYAALRFFLLAGAWLFFRQRVTGAGWALLLAVLTLLLAMVLLRILRELRLERYTRRETSRIRRQLTAQSLLLMERARLLALARPLANGEPRLILSAEPLGADALLPLARRRSAVAVVAPAGYTPAAVAFARRTGLRLIPQSALLDEAARQGLTPENEAILAHILCEEEQRRAQRTRLGGLPFVQGCAKKYLATALALFALSFLSRYALYYRLLATLCMSIFSVNFLVDRTRRRGAGIE